MLSRSQKNISNDYEPESHVEYNSMGFSLTFSPSNLTSIQTWLDVRSTWNHVHSPWAPRIPGLLGSPKAPLSPGGGETGDTVGFNRTLNVTPALHPVVWMCCLTKDEQAVAASLECILRVRFHLQLNTMKNIQLCMDSSPSEGGVRLQLTSLLSPCFRH